MSEELRPCPFCGGEAHVYETGKGPAQFSTYKYNIECDHLPECPVGESGNVVGDLDTCSNDLDKLKEAWNRRAERTCHMVDNGCELCCSECDCRHDYDDEPNYCHNCGARVVSE